MASNIKASFVVVFVFVLTLNAFIGGIDAAGECGKTPIRTAAASLSPCLSAAGNASAKVPPACCTKVSAFESSGTSSCKIEEIED